MIVIRLFLYFSYLYIKIKNVIRGCFLELSKKLKICRNNKNLTQAQVAKKLNISRKTISGWENGRSFPDTNSLVQLSDLYDISLDDLIRNDRLLDKYAENDKTLQRSRKIVTLAYYFSWMLFIAGYIEFFRPFGIHLILIPILMIVNEVIFISHYENWKQFKHVRKMILMIGSFAMVFLVNILLISIAPDYVNNIQANNNKFIIGYMIARLALIILITINIEIMIFFRKNV